MKNITKMETSSAIIQQCGLPSHVLMETAGGLSPVSIETAEFEQRRLYINGEINDELAHRFIMSLHIAAQRGQNLELYINSPGGSVSAGLAMLDEIQAYPFGIDIYCYGLCASMAAVLLAGGRKGHRFIMPHSKVMIHEPLIAGGLGGSATSIQRTAESIMQTKKVINEMLSQFTGRIVEEIDCATAFDNFFTAQEAIDFGLCDAIATGFERYGGYGECEENIYYGSEWGVHGTKGKWSDAPLRPAIEKPEWNELTDVIARLDRIHTSRASLYDGDYTEIYKRNEQWAYLRSVEGEGVFYLINIADSPVTIDIGEPVKGTDLMSDTDVSYENGIPMDAKSFKIILLK